MNLPALKVYEIDYEFIIKNYLNPKLWNKIWTVFVYDNYVFTLVMSSIDVIKNSVTFTVQLKDVVQDCELFNVTRNFSYNIKNSNIGMLKKSLEGTMLGLVEDYEKRRIEKTKEYKLFDIYINQEREMLKGIANEFLDRNNVTNEEIREVYIDNYINNNETMWEKQYDYPRLKKYTVLTKLYLMLAELFKREPLKNAILMANEDSLDIDEFVNDIKKTVEHMKTDEWKDEMIDTLEEL